MLDCLVVCFGFFPESSSNTLEGLAVWWWHFESQHVMRWWQWFSNNCSYSHTFHPQPVTECSLLFYWKMFLVSSLGALKVHNCCWNTFYLVNLFLYQMRFIFEVIYLNMLDGPRETLLPFISATELGIQIFAPLSSETLGK